MEHNSYLLEEQVELTVTSDGPIGTAAGTVDIAHHFGITTTANRVLTLPVPTVPRNGWSAIVTNKGSFEIEIHGIVIEPNEFARFIFDDGIWHSNASKPSPELCPEPMNRAQLRSLRNSGGLNKDCHYIMTGYSRGTVGSSEILLHAVNENTLSQSADIFTTHDNTAWSGRYDIDANRILELRDNVGNTVSGNEIVDTFPWGVVNITDNIVYEGGTFNYVSGILRGNQFKTGCNVHLEGGSSTFSENVVGENANLTWLGGSMQENVIDSDATVNVETTGSVNNNVFSQLSLINIKNGNVVQNTVGEGSRLTTSGGSVNYNTMGNDARLVTQGGSVNENEITSGSVVTQTSAQQFYQNTVTRNSIVTQGDLPIYQSAFDNTTVNTTGSTGSGIRLCTFENSRAFTQMRNVVVFDIAYCKFSNYSRIAIDDAARFYLRYVALENFGYIDLRAGTQLDLSYTGLRDYSYIRIYQGRINIAQSSLTGVSYIQQEATVTGANRVDSCTLTSRSRIRFTNTVDNCRVTYCSATAGSSIEHRGTSVNSNIQSSHASDVATIYTSNSVDALIYGCTAHAAGRIYTRDMTGVHYIYYCTASEFGTIDMVGGAGGRFQAVEVTSQGLLRLTGGTAASRLYSSSITAYFYLLLTGTNLTTTRYGVNVAGRKTYTPAAPIPNGTVQQNIP